VAGVSICDQPHFWGAAKMATRMPRAAIAAGEHSSFFFNASPPPVRVGAVRAVTTYVAPPRPRSPQPAQRRALPPGCRSSASCSLLGTVALDCPDPPLPDDPMSVGHTSGWMARSDYFWIVPASGSGLCPAFDQIGNYGDHESVVFLTPVDDIAGTDLADQLGRELRLTGARTRIGRRTLG